MADRLHASQEPSTLTARALLAIAGAGRDVPMLYWERPRDGVAMLGLGAGWELATSGRERFAVASRAVIAALGKGARSCDRGFGPFALGGFGFSDGDCLEREWREFPSLRLWIPELLWVRRGADCRLTRTWRGGEGCARAILSTQAQCSPPRARRPACASFWIRAGQTSSVGSSPERLVALEGNRFRSGAVAGSAPRSPDRVEDERRIERDGIEAFVDSWEALPLFATQAGLPATVRADLRRRRLACSPAGLAASLRAVGTGAQPWLGERLAELALPVCVVAGALDDKFRAIGAWMAARMRDARLEIVPEAGHAPHPRAGRALPRDRRAVLRRGGLHEGGRSCRFDGKRFMSTRTSRSVAPRASRASPSTARKCTTPFVRRR